MLTLITVSCGSDTYHPTQPVLILCPAETVIKHMLKYESIFIIKVMNTVKYYQSIFTPTLNEMPVLLLMSDCHFKHGY